MRPSDALEACADLPTWLLSPAGPDRAARRRRLEPEHEPQIQVIELRAQQVRRASEADQRPVDWHYQWIVRGHWRRQDYPSAQQHRPLKPPAVTR